MHQLIKALALTGVLVSLTHSAMAADTAAQRVFTGGAVYTVDRQRPWATAVAVRDGRIVYVGDDDGARPFIGEGTTVTALDGRMVLPGFHDSHMHPMAAGTRFLRCRLHDLAWPDEVLAKIRECAADGPTGSWLRGVGLPDAAFAGAGPTRQLLDSVVADRPAYITNFNGFLAWMNSLGLDAVGIDADTPTPEKGVIERDPETGRPTGTLRNAAAGIPYGRIPLPPSPELREALRRASRLANRYGITSVNAAKVQPALHAAYLLADDAGEMTLRVQASLSWRFDEGPEQLEALVGRRSEATGSRYRADVVKLTLDGDLIRRTGALLEPYADTSDDLGRLATDAASLDDVVRQLDAAGFDVHMHVIGDRAARAALGAIERAMETNGPRDRRHQLAHIELIHPDDLPRFAELGVVADFQALWAYRNPEHQEVVAAVGPERANRLVAIRSMLDTGATVVAGSDWISESMNPLFGIQIAVTRRPPDGSGPAWVPGERATLAEMIEAYTINGAWLARQAHETGSIEVGKAADLIVLEKNLFDVDPMTLKDVAVRLTLLEGEVVYRSAGFE